MFTNLPLYLKIVKKLILFIYLQIITILIKLLFKYL